MQWLRNVIGRPEHAHNVRNPDEYAQFAKALLKRAGVPPVLRERTEHPAAYVSDGRWVCDCDCGNGPSASPEWELAICCECGSVYQPQFPPFVASVEKVLLKRASVFNRHYMPNAVALSRVGRAETLADLVAENRARGVS